MTKLTLSDVTNISGNPTSAQNTLNANFAAIEAALETAVYRDGETPNQMEADFDMNSRRILNLPAPTSDQEPIRRQDLEDLVVLDGAGIMATQPEAEAGTTNLTFMSPLRTKQAIDYQVATIVDTLTDARLASNAEAIAGVDNDKLMTPLRVAQAFTALTGGGGGTISVSDANVVVPGTPGAGIQATKLFFNAGITNDVDMSVETKLRQWVNVKDFGVVADGTTNDAAAMQNAINSGYDLILPKGIIKINSGLTLGNNYQSIRGSGKNSTFLQFGTSGSIVMLTAIGKTAITLSDFAISLNNNNGNCFNFQDCSYCSLDRMAFYNVGAGQTHGSFQQVGGATSGGCVGCVVSNSLFYASGGHGMELSYGSQNSVLNCHFISIAWSGVNGAACQYNNIIGNHITGTLDSSGYGGIRLSNDCRYNHVVGNHIINSSRGIYCLGSSFNNFVGNTIHGAYVQGILIQGTATSGTNTNCNCNLFSGNQVIDSWYFGGSNQYAIHITQDGSNCNRNSLQGNQVIDTRGPVHITQAVGDDTGQTNYNDNTRSNL